MRFNAPMPYAHGRTYFDADSHIMELPEWLPAYADAAVRERIRPFSLGSTGTADRVRAMIARCGAELFMFSSDYPHVEGGRNPLKRFEASLRARSPAEIEAFYSGNFADLMRGQVG